MKIAILAPPWFAVPPSGYGGIEWIVWLLADGLADQGHDVTLFASGDSHSKAKLEAVFEHAPSELIGRTLPEMRHVLDCYERSDEFDVINDHTGHPGAVYRSIAEVAPRVGLISISMNQRKPEPDLNWVANVPNALDFEHYPC